MKNITFTPPSDQKIKDGKKWMTARYWRYVYGNMFKVGDRVTLSTGRKKETRFTEAEITKVVEWDGKWENTDAIGKLGMSYQEIAEAEGFETWQQFIDAYNGLNAHNLSDPYERVRRKHYFIQFELIGVLF